MLSDLSGNRPLESPIVDIGADFVWEEAFTDKYDYDSDSDLSDEEGDAASLVDVNLPSTIVHGRESVLRGSTSADSQSCKEAADVDSGPDTKVTQWQSDERTASSAHFQSVGRTMLVTDTAFKT
jgi:hypothetical protein